MIEKFTVQPARILGLNKGRLEAGACADLTLIDLEREETVEVKTFRSKSRNSPFQGWKLKGLAVLTVASGRIVHRVADLS
jgi:dihydroorotase